MGEQKLTGEWLDPSDDLFIYGSDPIPAGMNEDLLRPFADPHHLKIPVPDWMIADAMRAGIHKPIEYVTVRYKHAGKDNRIKVVVDGRTRVRTARIVKAKQCAAGAHPDRTIKISGFLRPEATSDHVVRGNLPMRTDGPMMLGRTIAQQKAFGKTDAQIQNLLRDAEGRDLSLTALRSYHSLTTLPGVIQDAIDAGEFLPAQAYEIAKIKDPAKALAAYQAMRYTPEPAPRAYAGELPAGAAVDPRQLTVPGVPDAPADPLPDGSPPPKTKRPTAAATRNAARAINAGADPVAATKAASDPLARLPSARNFADIAEALKPAEGDDREDDATEAAIALVVTVLEWAAGTAPMCDIGDATVLAAVKRVMSKVANAGRPPAAPRKAEKPL